MERSDKQVMFAMELSLALSADEAHALQFTPSAPASCTGLCGQPRSWHLIMEILD